MIILFLLLVVSTSWLLFKPLILRIPSMFIRVALTVFLSHYLFVLGVVVLSSLLAPFISYSFVLATYGGCVGMIVYIFSKRAQFFSDGYKFIRWMQTWDYRFIIWGIFLTTIVHAFFTNQLSMKDQSIYISNMYIDFHWHVRLIENFAFGNNFLPQNESVAGVYHVYHYMWSVIPALYRILGLNIALSINIYSTIFFMTLLLTAIGIVYEITKSKISYILVPLFIMTHGSLKFIDYISRLFIQQESFVRIFNVWPNALDFNVNGMFGYNGNMFNMYYYIQERQLIIAMVGLLLFLYILYHFTIFSRRQLIIIGGIFAFFLQWHLFVSTIIIITGSLYAVIYAFKKKHLQVGIIPFITNIGIILSLIILKLYSNTNPLFDSAFLGQFPQFNMNFSTMTDHGYMFSPLHALLYYVYAYGLRIILYVLAVFYIFKKNRRWGMIFIYSFIPVFIWVNTIQLSPLSIYDNHKWLKPFNFVMDMVIVTYCIHLVQTYKNFGQRCMLCILIFLTVLSGFISFLSYFLQKPSHLYGRYDNPIVQKIQKTDTSAVFLTDDPSRVFLGGRKTYFADYLGGNLGLKTDKRERVTKEILSVDKREMCNYLQKNHIDEVDYIYLRERKIFLECKK